MSRHSYRQTGVTLHTANPWPSDKERPRDLRLCCPVCDHVEQRLIPRDQVPTEITCVACGRTTTLELFLRPPRRYHRPAVRYR